MKPLHYERRALDLNAYKLRSAQEDDYDTLVTESSAVYENGDLMIVYQELDLDCADIVQALQNIRYETSSRTDGLPTTSRIFGFSPRVTIRKDFCSATSLAKEQPAEHALVCQYAEKVADCYQRVNNPLYEQHLAATEGHVIGEYRVKNSPFTSGIINKNNPLKYHFDTGNFKSVWSCMLVFKHQVGGGYLSVPEYGLGFELKHNSLFMFDGQGLLHGVTPIRKRSATAFRYSIVYYSLREMWNCLPITDELLRIRNLKTEREIKRTQQRAKPDFKKQ